MLSATTFQGYKKCCMLAMDVWCFSKSTIRVDLEKHQTRLHYWGNSLCNFEEAPLQFWVFLLCTKHEVMQIRAASWAAMIKQRNDSGLTIREWCAANGIQESVYYYRLNRLRKMALDVEETPAPASQNISVSERFAQLPVSSAPDSTAAIRIRRGDTVVEVSSDAPERLLSFLKEVMFRAV